MTLPELLGKLKKVFLYEITPNNQRDQEQARSEN